MRGLYCRSRTEYPVIKALLPQGRPTVNSSLPAKSFELRSRFVNGPDSWYPLARNDTQLNSELLLTNTYCRKRFWSCTSADRALKLSRRNVYCSPPCTWNIAE